jgi:5-methylcytosine-specific restriction endonuclease McrA
MAKSIKKEDRIIVYQKYNGKCAYCGVDLSLKNMQVDHIEPLFRGYTQIELDKHNRQKGKNNINNYNPSCGSCNASKSTFTIEQWRKQIEHKIICLKRDSSNFRILQRFGIVSINEVEVKFYFEKESEAKNG